MSGPRDNIKQWLRPAIQATNAYPVADATGMIKLDAMENPYTWPAPLVREWQALLANAPINRYPDPRSPQLMQRLRSAFAIPQAAGVLLGNGSDELILMLALALGGVGRSVLAPEPSFVMYDMISRFTGLEYIGVPLKQGFELDSQAMLDRIASHQPALVFLAYPNNPTGNLFDRATVEQIIQASTGLVIVDEAYAAFADDSFMADTTRFTNLLVMRTVSKMGLAGLRLGYMVGHPDWIAELDKVRLPYNINVLTQLSVDFALQHKSVLDEQTDAIRRERDKLSQALAQRDDLEVFPSQTNFVLFRTAAGQAQTLFDGLKAQGVLIKNLSGAGDALRDCLRVTVGTPEENAAFLTALDKTREKIKDKR